MMDCAGVRAHRAGHRWAALRPAGSSWRGAPHRRLWWQRGGFVHALRPPRCRSVSVDGRRLPRGCLRLRRARDPERDARRLALAQACGAVRIADRWERGGGSGEVDAPAARGCALGIRRRCRRGHRPAAGAAAVKVVLCRRDGGLRRRGRVPRGLGVYGQQHYDSGGGERLRGALR